MAYYPVNPNAPGARENPGMQVRTNENIARANRMVEGLAAEFGFRYIDVNDGLKDEAGNVIAETTPELDYAVVYISTEDMAQGSTYTLTAGRYSESITLSDNIYSNLAGGMGGARSLLGAAGASAGTLPQAADAKRKRDGDGRHDDEVKHYEPPSRPPGGAARAKSILLA